MLFNSLVFPIFFLIVWSLYLCLKRGPQNTLLLIASYVFYGWWDWRFLALLFISTATDYVIALMMGEVDEKRRKIRKILLLISLATSLGILGFFKYFNFFADSFSRICAPLGLQPDFVTLNILLPVGISFYTFQTMAYTIDVYRGKAEICRNFRDFALYVAYFPQLVAGPIERSQNLIPQFQKPRKIESAGFYSAWQLILMGYFKKMFIADGVAPIVNECFTTPENFGGLGLLLGAYLFALQVYGDFSGYTDIARGVSRLFGIELMLNFKQPYFATSISDFWRRWHISLSVWIRDYLYFPLGGNRKGKVRTYANNMTSMLLSGLWHGAAFHFVVWGGLHGLFLVFEKMRLGDRKADTWSPWDTSTQTMTKKEYSRKCRRWFFQVFMTFNLVCLSFVFFRASGCTAACDYLWRILHFGFDEIEVPLLYFLVYGLSVLFIDLMCVKHDSEVPFNASWRPLTKGIVYGLLVFLIVFVGENDLQPFIYFQF